MNELEQRLEAVINELGQATQQQRENQAWDELLESLRESIPDSILSLNKPFLNKEITKHIPRGKDLPRSPRSFGCCDLHEVGGHSHSRHESVTLTTPWNGFRRGQRLSMPATLAHGLRVSHFAR